MPPHQKLRRAAVLRARQRRGQDRPVPRNAGAPERFLLAQNGISAGGEPTGSERPDERHGGGELRRVHAGLLGKPCGQLGKFTFRHRKRPLRSLKGVLLVRAESEGKAHRCARAGLHLQRDAQAHPTVVQPARRVRQRVRRPVAGERKPALRLAAARQTPIDQRPAARFFLHAQPPERRMALHGFRRREDGGEDDLRRAVETLCRRKLQNVQLAVFQRRDGNGARRCDSLLLRGDRSAALREPPLRSAASCSGEKRQDPRLRFQPHGRRHSAEQGAAVGVRPCRSGLVEADVIVSVREQTAGRSERVRAVSGAQVAQRLGFPAAHSDPARSSAQDRSADRNALGEQSAIGAQGGVLHQPALHRAAAQDRARRRKTHAEMMRHDLPDDLAARAARAARCEVDRLIKPVFAAHPERLEPPQIPHCRAGLDQQGEKRAVRREHEFLVHPAPQRQRADAVRLVAVAQMLVEREKTALRSAPRQRRPGAPSLAVDAELRALPEQRFAHQRQKQLRHQILEHRARPGGQTSVAVLLHLRAAELPPHSARHVTLRDREECRQPRLARHQIIPAGRGFKRVPVQPDPQQPPRRIIKH